MEFTGLTNRMNTITTARQMSAGISTPASLGINNLSDVSNFVQATSSLGLHDTGKVTSFLSVAGGAGGLGSGNMTSEMATDCLNTAVSSGLITPANASAEKALSMINNAKALGLNANNLKEKAAAIQEQAEKFGITPQKPGTANNEEALASDGPAITGHKLKFVPFDFSDILEVSIEQNINEHARLYIKGVLKSSTASEDSNQQEPDDYTVQQTAAETAAALYNIDEKSNVECLFQGLITNVKQSQTTDLKYIEVEVVSPSYNLDITKNSRSFQRKTATYDDIISSVTQGEAEIKNCQPSQQTGKLIVQYKETDWDFLKRMASHHNTGLVPVITSDKVQIFFGVSKGQQSQPITTAAYSVKKALGEYRTTQANDITHSQPNISDIDFICYQVKSIDRFSIGDCVTFLDHTLYVQSIQTQLEKGALQHHYALVSENGLFQKDLFNPNLTGVSLMAQVKVITNDQIKAHIVEIDQEWDGGADWYFPYTTVFSSPDGSGWYAMPEPGDTVRIHFPSHKDEDAVATSSVNRDQSQQSQKNTEEGSSEDAHRSDPDKKSFSNKYGKEVLFTPDGIYITNQAGQMFINLKDADGITIVSEKDINIKTKENLIMKADKDVVFNGGESLKLSCGPALIQSEKSGLITIKGEEVKTN